MSNYPPGVTGNEPQIAGALHYRACPQFEGAREHVCNYKPKGIPVRYDVGGWFLDLPRIVTVIFCPWCGEELLLMLCQCLDIADDLRDEAAERKAERKTEGKP